jgi:hypothetical protein
MKICICTRKAGTRLVNKAPQGFVKNIKLTQTKPEKQINWLSKDHHTSVDELTGTAMGMQSNKKACHLSGTRY